MGKEATTHTMEKEKVTMEVTKVATLEATRAVNTEATKEARREATKVITTKVVMAEKAKVKKEKPEARLITQAGLIHMSGPWVVLWTT